MVARVRDTTMARPKPSITEVGGEVDPSTPPSPAFPKKIRGPTVISASSVTERHRTPEGHLSPEPGVRWRVLLCFRLN